MRVLGFGLDMSGKALFSPMEEGDMVKRLRDSFATNESRVRDQSSIGSRGLTFRGEEQRRVRDVGDPREAGWTYVLAANEPRRKEIIEAMRPLAIHRGMEEPSSPLVFDATQAPGDWLQDEFVAVELDGRPPPRYVLLVGTPDRLPFELHTVLDTVARGLDQPWSCGPRPPQHSC